MHFDLDRDQRDLQETLRRFCDERYPTAAVRDAGQQGTDRDSWRALAQIGVFSLCLPEDRGGAGLRTVEQVLAFEVLGAGLVPGPLVGTALAAGLLDGADDGSALVAVVTEADDEPVLVANLHHADHLLVVRADGVDVVSAREVDGEPVAHPLDPTTPLTWLRTLPRGERIGSADVAAAMLLRGSLLTSAQLLGIARRTTELAVAYAKSREQYGRTIGSFQAVKHMLADMLAGAEVASASVHAAGVQLDDPDADAVRAVAAARVLAARVAVANASTNIQVHGGMGFTWEFDAHLYLKRARLLERSLGTPDEAAETVAERLQVVRA